jgi:DNA polymerase III epsilon subunit family exonuclease
MEKLPADYEHRRLSGLPIAVVDTETTGLHPGLGHRVVEVAVLRLENMREAAYLSYLVNPGRAMDPGASRVNGITDDDLVDAPPFAAILPELDQLLRGTVIVAHNAAFDAGFLGLEYHLAQKTTEDQKAPTVQLDNPWLCTMRLARQFFYFRRNSLGNIAMELGVRANQAHRALNDVYTTSAILKRMLAELRKMGFHTAGDLLHAQGGPIYPPPPPRQLLDPAIADALDRQSTLHILYRSQKGSTERVIRPQYVTEYKGQIYLIAYCILRQAQRTFRLDRIQII